MNNILLDYFFSITVINPTPAASTAFLKQLCLVVKPKAGQQPAPPVFCATMAEVSALTDNLEAQQVFAAGMSGVYIMTANDLDLAEGLEGHEFDFFTLLISSDFSDDNVIGAPEVPGVPAIPAVKASLDANDVLVEALVSGTAGNSINFSAVGDTGGGGGGVYVETIGGGSKIVVHFEDGVSTKQDIVDGLVSNGVTVTASILPGNASELMTNFPETFLAGGAELVPEVPGVPAIPAMNLGAYQGVTGVSSGDDTFLEAQAVIENRCAFKSVGNGAKNMVFAFGKLLANTVNWANQQFITMPFSDNVNQLGTAKNFFEKRISFVIDDRQYGKRLAFFGCGGKAIVAPYIVRNLVLDMQSAALAYVSANQPGYTKVHAALLEDELQNVIDGTEDKPGYVTKGWITEGDVEIKLEQSNFVASGYIEIAEPGALWRIDGQLKQTTT